MRTTLEPLDPRRLLAFGDFAHNFGTAGVLPAGPHAIVDAIAGDAAGDLFTAGLADNGTTPTLRRLNANGRTDTTFGVRGAVTIAAEPQAIAVDSRGRVIVLVNETMYRYTAAGVLDSTFGHAGRLKGFTANSITRPALVVARDGSVYVSDAGSTSQFSTGTGFVYKISPAGRLDTAWADGGVYTTPVDALNSQIPTALLLDSDGTLLVVGVALQFENDTYYDDNGYLQTSFDVFEANAFVTRLTASGKPDTTFGTAGTATVESPTGADGLPQIAAVGGGKVAVAFASRGLLQVAEVDAAGSVDYAARTEGPTDLPGVTFLAALPDGRLVAANGSRFEAVTFRNHNVVPTSAIDAALNVGGTSQNGLAPALLTPDGGIVVAGRAFSDTTSAGIPTANATVYDLAKITVGSVNDPRPDEIPYGQQNALARSPDGSLNLAYYDARSQTLKFRRREATGRWDAIQTIDAVPTSGQFVSLDVSPTGVVGVAYYDAENADLHYAERSSRGVWSSAVIDRKNSTGLYPSLNFSNDGRPYIAYFAATAGDLRLAHRNADGMWAIETVDSAGVVGRHPSLRIDPVRGTFAIAYEGADHTVRLAERARKSWAFSTVAKTIGGTDVISLAFDYSDTDDNPATSPGVGTPEDAVVAFYDAAPADLVIARRTTGTTTFAAATVVSRGATGLYPQLILGESDTYHLSVDAVFWDAHGNRVQLADAGALLGGSAESGTFHGPANVLAADGGRFLGVGGLGTYHTAQGTPISIAYQDTASGDLFVRDV